MINTITIAALAALFLARAPVAFLRPHARPAWVASGTGILALLSIGVIIPIPVADSWLGGFNYLFLLRTALPVIAFWFLREAVALQAGVTRQRGGRFIMCGLLAAQVFLFLLIPDRGSTNVHFVDDHMIYPTAFLWAVVYAGAIIWISAEIVAQLLPFRGWLFLSFKAGGMMTVIGGLALVVHCALILARVAEPVSGDFAWILFNVFFYPGILLIVAGFVAITIKDAWALAPWRIRALHLRRALASYEPTRKSAHVSAILRAAVVADPMQETYDAAIALRNVQYLEGLNLRVAHIEQLTESEKQLEQMTALPVMVSTK